MLQLKWEGKYHKKKKSKYFYWGTFYIVLLLKIYKGIETQILFHQLEKECNNLVKLDCNILYFFIRMMNCHIWNKVI